MAERAPPPDWSGIEAVFLDMDGTLLDLHYDNYFWGDYVFRRHASAIGAPEAEVREWLLPQMQALRSTLPWYCVDYWSRTLGTDVMTYKAEVAERIGWRPTAQRFLEALGQAGLRRVLVTNAHPRVIKLKFERTGLGAHLDAVHSSHEFGHPKEERGFWDRLGDLEPVDPQRVALFDDNARALEQARTHAGITRGYGVTRPDLQRPAQTWTDHPAVDGFDEVFPIERPDARFS